MNAWHDTQSSTGHASFCTRTWMRSTRPSSSAIVPSASSKMDTLHANHACVPGKATQEECGRWLHHDALEAGAAEADAGGVAGADRCDLDAAPGGRAVPGHDAADASRPRIRPATSRASGGRL